MSSKPVLEKDAKLRFPHALLISASAGSGKTYTLTQRYVQFLLSDIIPGNSLQNILAVTFTNNAAKEMKVRILKWLKELALDKNCSKMDETLELVSLSRDEVHKRAAVLVDRIISDYSDFHVQTIDSFLARVMTASVDELKLPLDPEITMSYDLLIDRALYSLFSRIGKADLPAETVDKFLAVLPKTGSYPWNPAERVREIFNNFLNQEGRTEGVVAGSPGDYEDLLKARFAEALKACAVLQKRYADPGLFKGSSLAALEAKNLTDFLASYSFTYGILNGQKKKNFPAAWEKEIDRLNVLVIDLTELNAAAWYQPYLGIYGRFKEELERAKHGKTDVIHINDIAKKLSAYINAGKVPEIYLKLGERISHFLIDEFQDTNRLQWNVLRPLVEESLSKTGSLFVVGDIKQAIYMFRNADYKIMRDFLDKAEGKKPEAENISLEPLGGELKLVNLPDNYRSDGKVLDYVNALFRDKLKNSPGLIGEDLTGLTSYEQAVTAGRIKDGYVKTDVFELEDPSEPKEQKDRLLKIIAGARKRYPLNEIAVLVSRNKRIEPVVEWLTGAGIPVASLSSLDIRKRKVVAELIAYLKFLETPSDGLSFAAFLTGDIFAALTGLAREEMRDFILKSRISHQLPVTGYRSPVTSLLYAEFRNHAKYKTYWDKYLDEPFRKVGYLPLYELISLIYNSFKLFGNFPDEQAFLARFMDAVISLESEGVTGPRAFIEYASGDNEDKAAVFSIDLPEYIDAVRVMTFHKSKGLGFSVVINMLFDERGPVEPMYFEERDGAIHVYHITKEAAEVSARLGPVYKNHKTDSDVQDLNILYVISTRARHELYNLVVKKLRKTPAKEPKLLDIFETYESASAPPPGLGGEGQPVRTPEKPVDIVPAGRSAESRFDALKPTYAGFFETAEGELAHDILAHLAPSHQSQDISHQSPVASRQSPVTSHKPDSADSTLYTLHSALSALYSTYAPKYPFKFDEARIIKTLSAFLSLPQARELFAARPDRRVFTEAEFIDRNGNLFRMDRVIIDKDAVTVVDFKTGAENTEKYAAQMKNYLAIISEVYKKPAQGVLAYVGLKKIHEVKSIF
ncbi:MAG: UvrD-helicase domain-containing protein [Elusimicrobia bacterium]|nr:UvrD-helicase domain-containing protein [Elusimicrobiota bacterium]